MHGKKDNRHAELRSQILSLVKEYFLEKFIDEPFVPGKTKINYGGRFFNADELVNLVDSSLEFWLTSGRYARQFETELSKYLGAKYALLTNSGSSANLLAFMALTSDKLSDRKIKRHDEIITVAAAFPTTVTPIVQYNAVPVFVDVEPRTFNIDPSLLDKALSEKTRAVMLAHCLGNPFNIDLVTHFCEKHGLWLIEDNCDALGSKYKGTFTGTFGDIATCSFYPPHHITMGEGGAVITSNDKLYDILLSFRDWGRDCKCQSGQDNRCGKRFSGQYGDLPLGYDHKYIYSHFGYNLRATDMQAAIGCAQLKKLPFFIERRKENHRYLLEGLMKHEDRLILPCSDNKSEPSWFGFLMVLRQGCRLNRHKIISDLESNNIQTRMLFSGNLIKHPLFSSLELNNDYRIVGSLTNTDLVMNNGFWIGVYPGITHEQRSYMLESLDNILSSK